MAIALLRQLYASLDKDGKHKFIGDRAIRNERPAPVSIRGKPLFTWCLEKANVLHDRLLAWDRAGRTHLLPPPRSDDANHVCKRFLNFAIAGHNDTTYDQRARVYLDQRGELTLDSVDPRQPRHAPVSTHHRAASKKEEVVAFLLDCAESGCHLPNDDTGRSTVVLPWRTEKTAHLAMVMMMEARLKVPWES